MKYLLQLFAAFIIITSFNSCGYNKIVELGEAANSQWGAVEAVYQRRADLVPKLVQLAQQSGVSQSSINQLESARKAASISLKPEELTSDNIANYNELQGKLGKTLNAFTGEVSKQANFDQRSLSDFMALAEGTENRIRVERNKFNSAVNEYNAYIKKVPQNFTSGMMGFDEKAYFEAEKGAGSVK